MSLQLALHQEPHYARILHNLDRNNIYFDASITGEGKTEVSLFLAQQQNLNILVICPLNVVDVWETRVKKYRLQNHLVDVITYDTFKVTVPGKGNEAKRVTADAAAVLAEVRSNPFNARNIYRDSIFPNPNSTRTETGAIKPGNTNSYLIRTRRSFVSNFLQVAEEGAPAKIATRDIVEVRAAKLTQAYNHGNRQGLLIIFDEAHKGRNDSDVTEGIKTMAAYVMRIRQPTKIYMGYLSATLISKAKQALNILRIFGIVDKDTYFDESKKIDPVAVNDIVRYITYLQKHFNVEYADLNKWIHINEHIRKKELIPQAYDLCTKFILPLIRSKTKPRQKQGMAFDVYVKSPNYMVNNVNQLDRAIITNLIKLKQIQSQIDQEGMQEQLITALVERENLRVPLYWSVINTILDEYLTQDRYSVGFDKQIRKVIPKIIVGMSYGLQGQRNTVGIYVLAYYLQVFHPQVKLYVINGKAKNIAEQIAEFNGSPTPAILLANTASVAEGVSLHDGAVNVNPQFHYVRYLLALPQIDAVRAAQFNGRVDRYGNRSFPFILTLYPQINNELFNEIKGNSALDRLEESNIISLLADRSFVLNEVSGNYESNAEDAESDTFVLGRKEEKVVQIETKTFDPSQQYEYNQLTESTASNPIRLPGQNNKAFNLPVYANRTADPGPCMVEFIPLKMKIQSFQTDDWGVMAGTIIESFGSKAHHNEFNFEDVPKFPIKKRETAPMIRGDRRYIITDYQIWQHISESLLADVRYDFGTMPQALIYSQFAYGVGAPEYTPPRGITLGVFDEKTPRKTGRSGTTRKKKEKSFTQFGVSEFGPVAAPAAPVGYSQASTTFGAPAQVQLPVTGGYNPAPVTGGYNQVQLPVTSNYNQAPVTGGYNPAPVTGGYNPAPAAASTSAFGAPVAGNYNQVQLPVTSNYNQAPATGFTAAPATGFTAAPATGFTAAPATGFTVAPAPVTGGYNPAPVTGGYNPAPVTGGYNPAPAPATGFTAAPATGFTAAPATGFTAAPATGFTAAPATGFTAAPATGFTAAPATGFTAAPATGFTAAPATGFTAAPATGFTAAPLLPLPPGMNPATVTGDDFLSLLGNDLIENDEEYY